MQGENDKTAAKARHFSPLPEVFSLHSLSFTSPHIAGFCFFYSYAEVFGLKAWLMRYGEGMYKNVKSLRSTMKYVLL